MAEEKNITDNFDNEELGVIELTDETTGEEVSFIARARATIDGKTYFALTPVEGADDDFFIFSATIDGDDILFESIEDDDEFEKVEDYFNDLLFNEVNYDD